MFNNIFKGKTVLITGHTGFKGSWLSLWLVSLGAKVVGISIDIPTSPSHFETIGLSGVIDDRRFDITNLDCLTNQVIETNPDFIFHLAAQPLVKLSFLNPIQTWITNLMGTVNVLQSARQLKKKCVLVMITSDKAYENLGWSWGYRENDRLGGGDPYSASKASAELAIKSFYESFFTDSNIQIGIGRAGNVVGGGDWAKDRIVPDIVLSASQMQPVQIRNPNSTRPWQHVLEPLSGYLRLAQKLNDTNDYSGQAYNFGPPANQNHSVGELVSEMSMYWKNIEWLDVSSTYKGPQEASLLKLNCDKALEHLGWEPCLNFSETIRRTVKWYSSYYEGGSGDMLELSLADIDAYSAKAKLMGLAWA